VLLCLIGAHHGLVHHGLVLRRGGAARRSVVALAAPPLRPGSVAAVLSLNAGGMTARKIAAAQSALGDVHVYATASLAEAKAAADAIVEKGYATVVVGGGDGTLAAAIRDICAARRDFGEAEPLAGMPRFAPLPLGTGNAVARFACGPGYGRFKSVRGVSAALKTIVELTKDEATAGPREVSVPLMRVDSGELCFLAGCGFDAFLLNDYARLRERAPPVLKSTVSSVFGYFVATATATLPQYLRGKRNMRVRISAENASYVDPRRGDSAMRVVRAGPANSGERTVLYEGTATIVAAGSTPYYGGGMRLFPFARSVPAGAAPGQMHLRVARMSPWRFVPNVLGIFRGSFRSPNDALDFMGPNFTVELLDGAVYPFQHSGDTDSLARRDAFTLDVAGNLRFVDLIGMPTPLRHLMAT